MLLNPLTFHRPKTLSEAVELHSKLENVRLQAGGTFLLSSLKLLKRRGTKTPEHVISLYKVNDLRGIEVTQDKMVIKAMTTIDDLFESHLLDDNFKIFRTVCRNISTQPIRNMATVGGNLTCRYTWTEMPAVMIGLEAQMHFMGKDACLPDRQGQEEVIPADKFFQGGAKTDKIFTHVTIKRDKKATIAYRRVAKSMGVDIPLLSVFIKTYFEGDRFTKSVVSVNNCVSFAQRDQILENFLNQSSASSTQSKEIAKEALDHLDQKIYDTRSTDYKKEMFRVSIKHAIEELIENKKKGIQIIPQYDYR